MGHNTLDISNDDQLSLTWDMINIHMVLVASPFREALSNIGTEQTNRYLAFELGVIESFKEVLSINVLDDKLGHFNSFLWTYASDIHQDSSPEQVLSLWLRIQTEVLYKEVRELATVSVKSAAEKGISIDCFKRAVFPIQEEISDEDKGPKAEEIREIVKELLNEDLSALGPRDIFNELKGAFEDVNIEPPTILKKK